MIVGLAVNYSREIGIYICDCRTCSQLSPEIMIFICSRGTYGVGILLVLRKNELHWTMILEPVEASRNSSVKELRKRRPVTEANPVSAHSPTSDTHSKVPQRKLYYITLIIPSNKILTSLKSIASLNLILSPNSTNYCIVSERLTHYRAHAP